MQRAELKRSGVEWSFVADVKRKKAMTLKMYKKRNLQNVVRIMACIKQYDNYNGSYYSKLRFLRAISHSLR